MQCTVTSCNCMNVYLIFMDQMTFHPTHYFVVMILYTIDMYHEHTIIGPVILEKTNRQEVNRDERSCEW